MAAILPHLEVTEDVTPTERAYNMCVGTLRGLGHGEDIQGCPAPSAVLADAHAGLVGMVFLREAVYQALMTRQFTVHPGNRDWKNDSSVYLVLDQPIGPGPAWSPNSNPNVQQFTLLSWTSKMNAPSWSLPAGAPQTGGACPGAVAGQSVVPERARRAAGLHVNQGLGRQPAATPINLAQCICEFCYATGGSYSTGQTQYAQVLRFLWARQAIHFPATAPDGSPSTAFIETMVYAIHNTNYYLGGGKGAPSEPTGRRFFRIHDSGDFFEPEYLRQWKVIADRLPDITFWAPSRIWATPGGIDLVNEVNADPRNLIIRPSAYEVNEIGPERLGPGWAAATTVIHQAQNMGMSPDRERYVVAHEHRGAPRTGTDPRYTWDCRAYAVDDTKHTCRKAVAPPGYGDAQGKGCRACWIAPHEIVNYTLH